LKGGPRSRNTRSWERPTVSKKSGLKMKLPTDLDGRSIDPSLTMYSVELTTKILTRGNPSYVYFDQARAIANECSLPA